MSSEPDYLKISSTSAEVRKESYQLGICIGGGGASFVHECTHPRIPKTVFAVKVLRGNVDVPKLEVEIETMQRANHFHVARVRGMAFISTKNPAIHQTSQQNAKTPLVGVILQPRAFGRKGNTLREYLNLTSPPRGPSPQNHQGESYELQRLQVRETLFGWMRCLIGTLHYLHSEGISHGDIKPENILLNMVGGEECIVVTDFGISFYTDAPLEKDVITGKTQPGVTTHPGSIKYLQPSAFNDANYACVNNWGRFGKLGDNDGVMKMAQ